MAGVDHVSKVDLVQRVAELQAQIFNHTFSGIGTLTASDEKITKRNNQERLFRGFTSGVTISIMTLPEDRFAHLMIGLLHTSRHYQRPDHSQRRS